MDTLPQTLKLGLADYEKYLAIGEADRRIWTLVSPVN